MQNPIKYTRVVYPMYISMNLLDIFALFDAKYGKTLGTRKYYEFFYKTNDGFIGCRDDCPEVAYSTAYYYDSVDSRTLAWSALVALFHIPKDKIYLPDEPIELMQEVPVHKSMIENESWKLWRSRSYPYKDVFVCNEKTYAKITHCCSPLLIDHKLSIRELCDLDKLPFPVITIRFDGNNTEYLHYRLNKETRTLLVDLENAKHEPLFRASYVLFDYLDDVNMIEFDIKVIYKSLLANDAIYFQKESDFDENAGDNTYISGLIWRYFYMNFFVRTLPKTIRKTVHKDSITVTEGKGYNKRIRNKTILRTEHHLDLTNISISSLRHEIKCLCWGVRGHERHMSDGRKIWVKPYLKGKERNNPNAYVPKDYLTK